MWLWLISGGLIWRISVRTMVNQLTESGYVLRNMNVNRLLVLPKELRKKDIKFLFSVSTVWGTKNKS